MNALAVEEALWAAAPELAARARSHPRWLTEAIVDRSRRYTSERQALHRSGDATADLAARALFFSVVDAAKPQAPLVELAARGGSLSRAQHRVVDLGAGCGAMSLGLLATAAARNWSGSWELLLIDKDAAALRIAERALQQLAQRLGLAVTVRVEVAELTSARPQAALRQATLVLAGSLLNELPASAARALALAAVPPGGALLLIEPALRSSARALHGLRDEILISGTARVLAPCTHARTPCPMLARETDWCHEDRPWPVTPQVRAQAEATGLRDGNLKYSYLTLAAHEAGFGARPGEAEGLLALRVVSGALPGKGRKEMSSCGELGRVPLRRLDRRGSPATEWFDELRRGDVVLAPQERAQQGVAAGRIEIFADDEWTALPVLPAAAPPADAPPTTAPGG